MVGASSPGAPDRGQIVWLNFQPHAVPPDRTYRTRQRKRMTPPSPGFIGSMISHRSTSESP